MCLRCDNSNSKLIGVFWSSWSGFLMEYSNVFLWKLIDFMECDWSFPQEKHPTVLLQLPCSSSRFSVFTSVSLTWFILFWGFPTSSSRSGVSITDFILTSNRETPEDLGKLEPVWYWVVLKITHLFGARLATVLLARQILPSACSLGQWDLSPASQKLCEVVIVEKSPG